MNKQNLLLAFVMLALFAGVGTAQANCPVVGRIIHLDSPPGTTGIGSVEIAPLANVPPSTYLFIWGGDRFASMLANAEAGNLTTTLTGDASSCPRGGGSAGTLIYIDIVTNQ